MRALFVLSFFQSESFLAFSFAAVLLVSLAGLFYFIPRWKATWFRRLSLTAAIPSFFTCAVILAYNVRWSIFKEQNWIRLQRTIAWAKGFPLYPDPDTGPVMAAIYGPVSALVYWPAAWFDSPFTAIQAGLVVAMFLYYLPVFGLILYAKPGEPRRLPVAILACFCFFFLSSILTSLKEAAYTIHADAPALGFSALACGFLYLLEPGKKSRRAMWGSAVFVMLALASKQTAAPLLISLPFYVFLAHGWKALRDYGVILCVTGFGFLALFLTVFDPQAFFYHVLYLPSQHPSKSMDTWGFIKSAWRLGRECILAVAVSIPGVWHAFFGRRHAHSIIEWFRQYPWSVFFLTGFFMMPLAFLSHIKVGGSSNTLSFGAYFLLMGSTLALMSSARERTGERAAIISKTAAAAVLFYTLLLLVITIPVGFYRILKFNNQEVFADRAYDYVREHPGEAYFPRLTLIHLVVEGKLYHAADGLMDRAWAQVPVSKELFLRHIPENPGIIAFASEDHRKVLPIEGFSTGYADDPRLPGFTVYPREE